LKGWSCSFSLMPALHSSPVFRFTWWHFKDFLLGLLGTGFSREEIQTIGDRLAEVAPVQRASQ